MLPDEIVRKLLEVRGIVSEEDVREFLSEKPQLAHDPLLLPGAGEGAAFLTGALERGERICVYGDYDVDGICGTALLAMFLREAARVSGSDSKITYYIPSRIEEGYGLNNSAILAIKESGADAIATVDCGSVSAAEAAYARGLGLKMLITDHHDPDHDNLPDCIHINPKLKTGGGVYPFDKLSGAGVVFKLCGAIAKLTGSEALRAKLREQVDLVCIATIADVMPLVDENRTFVKYGLYMIRKGKRPALREMLSVAGVGPEEVDAREIAFGIAPRLNALGRLGDASEGVEFFLTGEEGRMKEIATRMDECNQERRRIQDEALKGCMELYRADTDAEGKALHQFLLLRPGNSHEGVAGIVAGKVRDETGLPCAVLSEAREESGFLKGSARGGGRLDLIALLRRHREMFERLGGHAAAAGFLIREGNEGLLRDALSRDIAGMLEREPDLLEDREDEGLEIGLADVTLGLAEALKAFAPFGSGNPKPVLSLCLSAGDIADILHMGQDKKHLRFYAKGLAFVFFGGADTVFPKSGKIRIVGFPEIDTWNGRRKIQFAVTRINVL